jgi:hypothetical protein
MKVAYYINRDELPTDLLSIGQSVELGIDTSLPMLTLKRAFKHRPDGPVST